MENCLEKKKRRIEGITATGWEKKGRNFMRRLEDKPPYLSLTSESHVVVGRAVPSAPVKNWADTFSAKLYLLRPKEKIGRSIRKGWKDSFWQKGKNLFFPAWRASDTADGFFLAAPEGGGATVVRQWASASRRSSKCLA